MSHACSGDQRLFQRGIRRVAEIATGTLGCSFHVSVPASFRVLELGSEYHNHRDSGMRITRQRSRRRGHVLVDERRDYRVLQAP